MVGEGIASGRGLGGELGGGLLTGVLVGSGDVWATAVGLGRVATGGVAPVLQATSKAMQKAPERSLARLMTSQRCRSQSRYAIR
jgi:hypothetical protein